MKICLAALFFGTYEREIRALLMIAAIVAVVILFIKGKQWLSSLPQKRREQKAAYTKQRIEQSVSHSDLPRDPAALHKALFDGGFTHEQQFMILRRLQELGYLTDTDKQALIGYYSNGMVTPKNMDLAMAYARELSAKGSGEATLSLARLLIENSRGDADLDEAYQILKQFCRTDDHSKFPLLPQRSYIGDGAFMLGKLLLDGYKGEAGKDEGYFFLFQAALAEQPSAMRFYKELDGEALAKRAELERRHLFSSQEQRLENALLAARYGSSYGCYDAAMHFYEEEKGDADVRAFLLARFAAELGQCKAAHILSVMYYNGRGTRSDEHRGREWTQKAAALGSPVAMHNMGIICDNNGQDYQAFSWYKKAAEAGCELTPPVLEKRYRFGIGTKVDVEQADLWKQRADEISK